MRVASILTGLLAASAVLVVTLAAVAGTGRDPDSARGWLVPTEVARGTPVAQGSALVPGTDLRAWAAGTAGRTGIPARALRAYGAAELAQQADSPGCRLSWATVAGIGKVESNHGQVGRAELDGDGVAWPPIIGVSLDGSQGVADIRDTDDGRLDGDSIHDRAVGPLQFLPATWERFGVDADGDGVRNPQQIDDAARAAAAYLCAEGRDIASGTGWWNGVLTYNRSISYARLVWTATDRYAGAAA